MKCAGLLNREVVRIGTLLFIVSLLASIPFLSTSHVNVGVDMAFHLSRIEGIKEGILSGQFPVRVNPVQLNGYGMPTGIFYPDFFFYFPALLRLLGAPLLVSWKVFLTAINFVTVFASWWAFTVMTRSLRIGAVASCLYLVSFYRLSRLYFIADAPEFIAWAFLPAAMAAVWITIRRNQNVWPLAVIFSTGVFLSHVLTGVLLIGATVFMAFASLKCFRQKETRKASAKAVVSIFFLNLWVYAPLFYFHVHMDYPMKAVTKQEVFYQVIFPLPDFDFYVGSTMIFLLAGLAIGNLLCKKMKGTMKGFWALFIGSIVMLLMIASPGLWHFLGKAAGFLQAPLRLTVFPTIFLSLAAAIGLEALHLSDRWRRVVVIVTILLVGVGNYYWLSGAGVLPWQSHTRGGIPALDRRTDAAYLSQLDLGYGYNGDKDYMDAGTRDRIEHAEINGEKNPLRMKLENRKISPDVRILQADRRGNNFSLCYAEGQGQWIQLPLFWYMGYVAQDSDGVRHPVRKDGDGQVSVWLPPASGILHIWYDGLPWVHVTDLISWFSLFVFLHVSLLEWKRT